MSTRPRRYDNVTTREIKYLVVIEGKKAICCICNYNFANTKSFNILRHYKRRHETNCNDWSNERRYKCVQAFRKQHVSVVNPPAESRTATPATSKKTKRLKPAGTGSDAIVIDVNPNDIEPAASSADSPVSGDAGSSSCPPNFSAETAEHDMLDSSSVIPRNPSRSPSPTLKFSVSTQNCFSLLAALESPGGMDARHSAPDVSLRVSGNSQHGNLTREPTVDMKPPAAEAPNNAPSSNQQLVSCPLNSTISQNTENRKETVKGSYAVSWEIFYLGESPEIKKHFDPQVINSCAIAMVKNDLALRQSQAIPLSRRMVSQRVVDINKFLVNKLHALIQSSVYYSLCLNENTDFADVNQLAIFIRTVQSNFTVNEELLALVPLHTARGTDVFQSLKSVIDKFTDFSKCSCIMTDGAPSMTGTDKSLISLLRKNGVDCPVLHSIIHQGVQSLALSTAFDIVVKIINLVRGGNRPLSHFKLKCFLKEKSAAYDDLLLHTDVRWLSAGKKLERFFAIRKELLEFLKLEFKSHAELYVHLENPEFLCAVAFLTDMTCHLNDLNSDLQVRDHTVADFFGCISSFKRKLILFSEQFEKECLVHFPKLQIIKQEYPDLKFSTCQDHIKELLNEINSRFGDFDQISSEINLFANPLGCIIEDEPAYLQLELCDLQSDPYFHYTLEKGAPFFKLLPAEKYPNLHMFGLKMLSFFGSTYICERGFTAMKAIKSSYRNSLNKVNLESALRIAVTKIPFNLQKSRINTR